MKKLILSIAISVILTGVTVFLITKDNITGWVAIILPLATATISFITIWNPHIATYIWAYIVVYLLLNSVYIGYNIGLIFFKEDTYLFVTMTLITGLCLYGVQWVIQEFTKKK